MIPLQQHGLAGQQVVYGRQPAMVYPQQQAVVVGGQQRMVYAQQPVTGYQGMICNYYRRRNA